MKPLKPLDINSLERNTPKFKGSKATRAGDLIHVKYQLKRMVIHKDTIHFAAAERRFFRGWCLVVNTLGGQHVMKMNKKYAKLTAQHINAMTR